MASTLPHNAAVREALLSYVQELKSEFESMLATLESSSDFKNVFKTVWATDEVLRGLTSNEVPKLGAARSIIRRTPVLLSAGQLDGAKRELRRFIELVFWTVYFSDHPIEYEELCLNATDGIVGSLEEPIKFCAHRERVFYGRYASELMKREPSGKASVAVTELQRLATELNRYMHAGGAINRPGVHIACDTLSPQELSSYGVVHRKVCSCACVLLAGYKRRAFDRLSANQREWFDWLVGPARAKAIRSAEFGIPR